MKKARATGIDKKRGLSMPSDNDDMEVTVVEAPKEKEEEESTPRPSRIMFTEP